MSLPSDPSVNFGSTGNAIAANTNLALSASTSFTADFSTSTLGGFVQVFGKGGSSVSSTNGLQVQAFTTADGSTFDTIAFAGVNFTIPITASTTSTQSFLLPTGKYSVKLTNLDATYPITVEATTASVS
jgi:hypothetical protein